MGQSKAPTNGAGVGEFTPTRVGMVDTQACGLPVCTVHPHARGNGSLRMGAQIPLRVSEYFVAGLLAQRVQIDSR